MPSTPDSRAGWASYARALTIRDHAFIDGAFQPAADADTFPSINPADGTVIADVAACGPDDVDLAVAPARRSFEAGSWSRATPARRLTAEETTELVSSRATQKPIEITQPEGPSFTLIDDACGVLMLVSVKQTRSGRHGLGAGTVARAPASQRAAAGLLSATEDR